MGDAAIAEIMQDRFRSVRSEFKDGSLAGRSSIARRPVKVSIGSLNNSFRGVSSLSFSSVIKNVGA